MQQKRVFLEYNKKVVLKRNEGQLANNVLSVKQNENGERKKKASSDFAFCVSHFAKAAAKEGEVREPTGAAFLHKYGLGAPSTAARLLNALTEKEMLLETKTLEGSTYCVYNVFLSRWLEKL